MAQLAEKREAKSAQIKDAAFDWEDPLDLEGELTEEERMVRDTARAYAQDKLLPRVLTAYREETLRPRDHDRDGRARLPRPDAAGGIRRRRPELCRLRPDRARDRARRFRLSLGDERAVARWSCTRSTPTAPRSSGANICRSSRAARLVGCFGLTEPDHGSDPGSMVTRAEKVDGGYRLNGAKMWITNAPIADVAVVWAKLDGKIRGFIVERGTKGFQRRRSKASSRCAPRSPARSCSTTSSCRRKTCCRTCRGLRARSAASTTRATASPGARWARRSSAGTARAQYALDRKQFGRPLAANQLVQKKLADMQTEITLGLQGALRLGRLMDEGKAAPPAISLMKRNNCGKALDIAREARDMHGGNGISDEYHVMRHVLEPGDRQHLRGHARRPRADPRPRADRHPGVYVI